MAPSEEELSALTLSDLADAIRNGEISAAEAMAATLARIERLDPHLNAFIWRDGERAMARAKEADAARGRGEGDAAGARRHAGHAGVRRAVRVRAWV